MRLLKTIKVRNIKCSNNLVNSQTDWPSGRPREGHVGVMLGSSWPMEDILRDLNMILPTKIEYRGVDHHAGTVRPGPGPPRGRGYRGRGY